MKKWIAGDEPIEEWALKEMFIHRVRWLALSGLPPGTPLATGKARYDQQPWMTGEMVLPSEN